MIDDKADKSSDAAPPLLDSQLYSQNQTQTNMPSSSPEHSQAHRPAHTQGQGGQRHDDELTIKPPDQPELDNFVASVGARVRQSRQQRSMSARSLSELSGVSLRYLSLLENGKGNISISLLYKVACALGQRVEWFLTEQDPTSIRNAKLLTAFAEAEVDVQNQVMGMLKSKRSVTDKRRRVCLIGLRGAGKSTLGLSLSEQVEWPFVELNREIESICAMNVAELISLYGQEGYRKLEHKALIQVVESQDCLILAVAGGIVAAPESFQFLLRNFHTVWVKARPEEHMQRVREQGDIRPMVGNPAAMADLRSILTSREALYSSADMVVDTSNRTLEQSSSDLYQTVRHLC